MKESFIPTERPGAVVASRTPDITGLAGLRRGGTVTELLFLYECATLEPTQLRPIAERLGLTVQAVSHSYRQLRGRGLVTVREGRYRPTVEGVAWLHETFRRLGDDLWERIEQLHVFRSTRALALEDLAEGASVSLELRNGLLSARSGAAGPSRGRVLHAVRKGSLAEVSDLEGIVALIAAPISVRTLTSADLADPRLGERVRRSLPANPTTLLAAEGLEAYLALSNATPRPVLRFAPGYACLEAAAVGVPSYVLVLETGLSRLLDQFGGPNPPPLEVAPLPGRAKAHRPTR
jgi:predicted transcriptional regulator